MEPGAWSHPQTQYVYWVRSLWLFVNLKTNWFVKSNEKLCVWLVQMIHLSGYTCKSRPFSHVFTDCRPAVCQSADGSLMVFGCDIHVCKWIRSTIEIYQELFRRRGRISSGVLNCSRDHRSPFHWGTSGWIWSTSAYCKNSFIYFSNRLLNCVFRSQYFCHCHICKYPLNNSTFT